MKKHISKIMALILSLVLIGSTCALMTSCSPDSALGGSELKIMLSGTKPAGFDKVVQKFEEDTKDTLGLKLRIEWVASGDMKDKLKLRMNAGEEYDLVFDAPFLHLRTLAANGAYTPIESYFNNDEYPGLRDSFEPDVIKANYYYGHLYSVPLMRTYGSGVMCVFYRQDIAEGFGIKEITNDDELKNYFDKIQNDGTDMIPFGITGARGFYTMFRPNEAVLAKNNITILSAGNLLWYVLTNPEGTEVIDIAYEGAPESAFANFPAPYNTAEFFYGDKYNKNREFNQYVSKDSINEKDSAGAFAGGKVGGHVDTLDSYETLTSKLAATFPDAKLGIYIYPEALRLMEPEARATNLQANNFLCVPVTSKKPEKAMKFLDWIFSNADNHDLFELGIEGENWKAVGDDQYELIQGATETQTYVFPGYVMTWNPSFVRFPDTLPDEILAYKKYDLAKESYIRSPLAGFNFDVKPVTTDAQILKESNDKVTKQLGVGTLDEPVKVLQDNRAEAQVTIDLIKSELNNQINKFLDEKVK